MFDSIKLDDEMMAMVLNGVHLRKREKKKDSNRKSNDQNMGKRGRQK